MFLQMTVSLTKAKATNAFFPIDLRHGHHLPVGHHDDTICLNSVFGIVVHHDHDD